MDKNQPIKTIEAKSFTHAGVNPPKLTVEQIIKKFVNPSSHRKIVQLSEADLCAYEKMIQVSEPGKK